MIFSYNWLKDYLKGKIPKPEKLAELLTIHSFEVGEVKKSVKDYILDIDVLPNRACDCFSHLGIAREISAITGLKSIGDTYGKLELKEDKKIKAKDFITVEVKDKQACPRYTARVITDVKVGSSPRWIQEMLKICGLRPINNIVDIVNYVMLETGQPLHAFDFDKIHPTNYSPPTKNLVGGGSKRITNKKIIIRKAKKGEKIVTLDDEKYDLDENILIIADTKDPLAIAGIKGGKSAEIDKKTKNIILESANFDQKTIRKTSRSLNLRTDASWRFEHGIDPNLTEFTINRAASLIQEIACPPVAYAPGVGRRAGGKIAQGLIDFYPKKACPVGSRRLSFGVLPKRIKLDFDYVERLLGIKISPKEIKNILKKLNFQLFEIGSRTITVEVPTRRLDISIPEDLIEEVGRIYGYEKIPATFPMVSLITPKRNLDIFWEDMTKNILKEVGFSEVYNYSFIGEREAKIFKYKTKELIEVENPISLEQKYLRLNLIPNLLKNVQKNQRYFDEIKIFELGKTFEKTPEGKNQKIIEKRILTAVMTGKAFYQLKGVIDSLLNKLGISNIWYDSYQPTPEESKISIWHPKKCAEIKVNGDEIGFLGEISPKILEDSEIEGKVVIFDLDFEKLSKLCSEEHEYQPISRYPAAVRDIAILVPREIRVEEVLNKIETAGGALVRDIDLFDIYEGEEIPRGKKNLAFHIIYQAEDRTLSSKEIEEIQNKIIKVLEENPEWTVRR